MDLGAIDDETGIHTIPSLASKSKKYKCIDCDEFVFLKQGKIRKPHFSHYAKSDCTYYDHPNESQIHKDCKHRLKSWLEQKIQIEIYNRCFIPDCQKTYHIKNISLEEEDEVVLEYRDPKGKYVADVAIVNKGNVKYIFEVLHTHTTKTDRPEPWYEFRTCDLISIDPTDIISLLNVRRSVDYECYQCKYGMYNPGAFDISNNYYLPLDDNEDLNLFCMICKKPVKLETSYYKPVINKSFKRFKHIETSDCCFYDYWKYDELSIFDLLDIDALYKLIHMIYQRNKMKIWWRCNYLRDSKYKCFESDFEGSYPTITLNFIQPYIIKLNKKTKTITVSKNNSDICKFIIGEPKGDKNSNHYYFDKEDVFFIDTDRNDLVGALNVYNDNQTKYCSDCENYIEHLFDD